MDVLNQILAEYPQLTFGGLGATACATGALIYRIATRKKPTHVKVNCWFCNQDSVVPYGNGNSWDCPSCEQYNGFQENGDYNKPIPAQHNEHMNQTAAGSVPLPETPQTLQWVNCQMLLCKRCNSNQAFKVKQLASFVPREDEKYDEEVEVYRQLLEQTHKLCRPCQTAVRCYIQHQNRKLRALLFNHQLGHGREADRARAQSLSALSTSAGVSILRLLAFLTCAFLLAMVLSGVGEPLAFPQAPLPQSGGVIAPKPVPPQNGSTTDWVVWPELLGLLPEDTRVNVELVWKCSKDHQVVLVSIGLFTCVLSVFLAQPIRRIDAVASVLWLVVLCVYLGESYVKDIPSWLYGVKLSSTSLCCLVGLIVAVSPRPWA